ncbi:MAG TPA: hypothetical protein VE174_09075, partial [Actinomycetota bacterium]|nr:hypothetical protein [Actinomycetota bacterium]
MTRALWTRALAICVLGVLVASLAVAGADAHIGSSHSPYTTSGPDLVSVEIDGNRTDFCFDEAVTGPDPFVADRFTLRGYDSAIELVGDNVSTEARDNCVSVTFNAALPDRELTIGTVAAGAVEDIT